MPKADEITPEGIDVTRLEIVLECAYQIVVFPKIRKLMAELGSLYQTGMLRQLIDERYRSDPEWLRSRLYHHSIERLSGRWPAVREEVHRAED